MSSYFNDKNRKKALAGTLLFHLALLVLFLFIGLKTPVPPPEEQGIEIALADFGFTNEGSGEVEAERISPQTVEEVTAVAENVTPTEVQEEMVVQEESPVEMPAEEEVEERKPNPMALYKKPNPSDNADVGSNEGESDGIGNQGIPEGEMDGHGTFGGNGSGFWLGGRKMLVPPKIREKPRDEGTVVLNIWVDRSGNITRTSPNLAESNTTSQYLFNLAEKAAKDAKFNSKMDAAVEQRGKIKFVFILR